MLVTEIDNHVQAALGRLLQQYKRQPQLAALITTFVQQFQNLENAIYSLDKGRQLSNAVGAQLDGIGQIVGVDRNGLSDVEYLIFILGTIAENNSDTTIPTMLNIVSTIFEPIILIFKEMFPGEVGIGIGGSAIGLAAGQLVFGGQFPTGTSIAEVITQPVQQNGLVTNGSQNISGLDTTTLAVGMLVSGATFSGVTAVTSIVNSTTVQIASTASSSTGIYSLIFSAVLSMNQNSNITSTGAIFETLDAYGNVQNTFTGNTIAGIAGITDFQVQLSRSLQLKIGTILQNSLGAGITLGFLTFFDASNSFACGDLVGETSPLYAGSSGCGDVTNPSVGGQLATLIYSNITS